MAETPRGSVHESPLWRQPYAHDRTRNRQLQFARIKMPRRRNLTANTNTLADTLVGRALDWFFVPPGRNTSAKIKNVPFSLFFRWNDTDIVLRDLAGCREPNRFRLAGDAIEHAAELSQPERLANDEAVDGDAERQWLLVRLR
jgi:hypothetical protein